MCNRLNSLMIALVIFFTIRAQCMNPQHKRGKIYFGSVSEVSAFEWSPSSKEQEAGEKAWVDVVHIMATRKQSKVRGNKNGDAPFQVIPPLTHLFLSYLTLQHTQLWMHPQINPLISTVLHQQSPPKALPLNIRGFIITWVNSIGPSLVTRHYLHLMNQF